MAMDTDDISGGSLRLFCLAAEAEGFTAAAAAAGVTPAAVSRAVGRLETRLGVRLFVRTTRRVRLTDAGRHYYERCRDALEQLAEAERTITGQQSSPSGRLRIGLPTTYAHYRVLPLLPSFHARFQGVQVDAHIGNRNIDLVAEGYDLVVRARAQPDSTLIARKLEDAELVVVAAPEYLARAGVPESLEDLSDHDCIQFVLPSSGRRVPWSFRREGTDLELETVGSACCLEDLLGGITLARHGGGLYQAYRFTVAEDLAAGRLVEVLGAFGGRSRPFSVLYPSGRHLPLRTRVFIDFLFDALKL